MINFATVNDQYNISQCLLMLFSNSLSWNNTGICSSELLWISKKILIGTQKLSLVVCASISNNNRRGILVWHDHSWLRESASERVWVIWLERFLYHPCMQILSHFVLLLRKWYSFLSFSVVYWLRSTIVKC